MTKFPGATRARRARLAGVLIAVPAMVFAAGYFVVNSLAAPAYPAPAITSHPPNPSPSASASFAFSSARTAAGFRCALDSPSFASCASPATLSGLPDGSHTFRVEAVYGSGATAAVSSPASYSWRVVPAAPVIASGPADRSADSSPKFTFTDASWPNVTFTCWLDLLPHMGCTGGTAGVEGLGLFSKLTLSRHCLFVLVTDHAGNQSAVTRFCWTIVAPQNFTVGGNLGSPLYPGTSLPLNLTFTNPNPTPITIPGGGVSASNITITSSTPGCSSSNFAVTRGLAAAVTIPGHQATPTSLSALGVSQANWPVIEMIDTNTNQNACQGAKLTLTYAGIEATG